MPWVETEPDQEFIQWIKDFSRDRVPEIYALLESIRNEKEIYIFKNRHESETYLTNTIQETVL